MTPKISNAVGLQIGVSHVAPKRGLLEPLPFGIGVVSRDSPIGESQDSPHNTTHMHYHYRIF